MALTFSILDWKAWTPAHDMQPDVSVIPAMLRRRLTPLGRAALSVIMPLAETHGAMPLVYVSRHGDLTRTLGLLEDLARGEPLSPTAFSLSVHNATAGLFSIQQGLTHNITAVSGGVGELVPGLLESLGLCNEQTPQALCVFCDEPVPAIYQQQVDQPEQPYALALVLGLGQDWQLTCAGESAREFSSHPQALQLLELLQGEGDELPLASNGSTWQLRRNQP
jgi:hypothetical protein